MITDLERINKFINIVEKLKNSQFIKTTKNIKFELNVEIGENIKQQISGYDEDQFRSMLMDLRKLLMVKDGVKLDEICDLIVKNTNKQDVIKNVTDCKRVFKELMDNPPINIIKDGESFSSEDIIKLWLYGHYVHEDDDKTKRLNNMGLSAMFIKYNFTTAITKLLDLSIIISNNAKIL